MGPVSSVPHAVQTLRVDTHTLHRRQLVKLATSTKAGIRALLAKHNIRLSATQLDSDTATGLMDALVLPGTYAQRLASQRRLMLVLAATQVELHRSP